MNIACMYILLNILILININLNLNLYININKKNIIILGSDDIHRIIQWKVTYIQYSYCDCRNKISIYINISITHIYIGQLQILI